MKKRVLHFYTIIAVCCLLWLFYIAFSDGTHNSRLFYSTSAVEWTEYNITTGTGTAVISGDIALSNAQNNILAFYTSHVNISVYVDNKLVYEYPVAYDYTHAKTAGYCWNMVALPADTNHVTIKLTSYYPSYDVITPVFLVGNTLSIITRIFADNIATLSICVLIFFLGICMLVFWAATHKKVKANRKLLYLGIFAVLLSVWSLNESRLTILLVHNNIISCFIAFTSLLFLPATFCFFIQTYYQTNTKIWTVFYVLDLIQITTCLLLQVFHIYDLRETLWSTHAMCLFLAIITFYYSIKLLIEKKNVRQVVIHLVCISIFICSLIADMVAYYIGVWDNNVFGRIGFMIYLITMGLSSMYESTLLMRLGKKATAYHQLAYTDQMTTMNNRAAFQDDFAACSQEPEDVAVLDFDLNNLKKTNDTYGHNVGDAYIIHSAQIIKSCFDNIGKCYRVGGDEFVVLVKNASNYDFADYFSRMEEAIQSHNWENKSSWMTISYGYAIYSAEQDYTLKDTYERADHNMYLHKRSQKEA